jgi:GT2 family glycosyltransferase
MIVSVVVPIRNAISTLPTCLEALVRLDPRPDEIVLVDNGSTDGTSELLNAFGKQYAGFVKVIQEPTPGVSRARNAGIRASKGDVLAWTDSDCAPAPNWLRHLTKPFEDQQVGGVAGRVLAAPGTSLVEIFCGLYTFQTSAQQTRLYQWTPLTGGVAGANFAVRRALVEKLGGYDPRIMNWGDDYDLCARIYADGHVIDYVPEAEVFHYHRKTVSGMMRQAFGQGRSHPYLLWRHAPRGLWLDVPAHSLYWKQCPRPVWINLASADKKIAAIILLGCIVPPMLWLVPLYGLWLSVIVGRRAKQAGYSVSIVDRTRLAALLLAKSCAITAGRWRGSVQYGVICF